MKRIGRSTLVVAAFFVVVGLAASPPASTQEKKPNILPIMGDDVGWFNIGVYDRGMMSGKTPNLDRLAYQGMLFTDYDAEASCTVGRAKAKLAQSAIEFPPMQAPATLNLDAIKTEIQDED